MDRQIMYEHGYCEPEERDWNPFNTDYTWLREHCERMLKRPLDANHKAEHEAVLELIWKDTAWKRAIAEINDWGAYIQETDGETDQLKGINFCLGIIKKHLYCD